MWSGTDLCTTPIVAGGTSGSSTAGSSGTVTINGGPCLTAPNAVTTLVASTGSVGDSILLTWTAPGDNGGSGVITAGTYDIQYASYTSVVFSTANAQVGISTSNVTPGTSQSYTLTGLTGNVTYYLRLWTVDEVANVSGISNGATNYAEVYAPTAVTPSNGGWVNTSSPTFTWSEQNTTSTLNTFDLSGASNFASIMQSSSTVNLTFQSTVTLTDATTYDWRLRSIGLDGEYSPNWSTYTFTTDFDSPTASGFQSYNAVGSTVTEAQYNNLQSGVTAQMTVRDVLSGLAAVPLASTLTQGLIAYWPFDETAQNASPADVSGSGHNGTAHNFGGSYGPNSDVPSVAFADPRSLSFDGSSTYADVGSWMNLQTFSIAFWVKAGASQVAYADIIDDNHTSNGWVIEQNNGATNQFYWAGIPIFLTAGSWTHVIVTHNLATTSGKVYINGSLVGTNSSYGTITYNSLDFRIGNWAAGGRNFNGKIDDVRVYNRELSAAEAQTLGAGLALYNVQYSTNAAQSWQDITSSITTSVPYVALTGSAGSTTPQTLQAIGLTLATSTNTTTCNGVSPCGATNQVMFYAMDVAGNVGEFGPYAILVDTMVPAGINVTAVSSNTITVTWNLVTGATQLHAGGFHQLRRSAIPDLGVKYDGRRGRYPRHGVIPRSKFRYNVLSLCRK